MAKASFFQEHGLTGPVARVLLEAGQGVEDGALPVLGLPARAMRQSKFIATPLRADQHLLRSAPAQGKNGSPYIVGGQGAAAIHKLQLDRGARYQTQIQQPLPEDSLGPEAVHSSPTAGARSAKVTAPLPPRFTLLEYEPAVLWCQRQAKGNRDLTWKRELIGHNDR